MNNQQSFKCKVCSKRETPYKKYSKNFADRLMENKTCFICDYWVEITSNSMAFIYDGESYIIGPENQKQRIKGCGGRKFKIIFEDGREFITTNLWLQGDVPEYFVDKFPNKATYLKTVY